MCAYVYKCIHFKVFVIVSWRSAKLFWEVRYLKTVLPYEFYFSGNMYYKRSFSHYFIFVTKNKNTCRQTKSMCFMFVFVFSCLTRANRILLRLFIFLFYFAFLICIVSFKCLSCFFCAFIKRILFCHWLMQKVLFFQKLKSIKTKTNLVF